MRRHSNMQSGVRCKRLMRTGAASKCISSRDKGMHSGGIWSVEAYSCGTCVVLVEGGGVRFAGASQK